MGSQQREQQQQQRRDAANAEPKAGLALHGRVVGEESPPGVTSWTSFDFDLDSPKVVPTAARTPPPLEMDSG